MRFLVFVLPFMFVCSLWGQNKQFYLLVGTYTDGKSEGIYTYNFNTESGTSQLINKIKASNPSYLAISKNEKQVYAIRDTRKGGNSEVVAYHFNKANGELTEINKKTEKGSGACYITVDSKNKWLFLANYASGNLSALSINKDGSIDTLRQFFQDTGKSINPQRQQEAHIHTTVFSPNEKYLFVTDLGNDKIHQFSFDADASSPLGVNNETIIKSKGGNGPRHIEFSKNGHFMYVINELSGTIDVFNNRKNHLDLIQNISTDSTNSATKGSADIHISPDSKFLYATNRGNYNTIAAFSIQSDGQLKLLQVLPTGGIMPRNFVIDPTGNFLLIGHQKSDNIIVFKRNMTTGLLIQTNQTINVGSPVCLKFMNL